MKRRVLSTFSLIMVLCLLFCGTLNAEESRLKQVDGSFLTQQDEARGSTEDGLQRGIHLMQGDSMISKAGVRKIYAYTQTTASHDVDKLGLLTYVDQYNEETEKWEQIDAWSTNAYDTYYVVSGKLLEVDGGYYYRVTASHMVEKDGAYESSASFTDGIWIE